MNTLENMLVELAGKCDGHVKTLLLAAAAELKNRDKAQAIVVKERDDLAYDVGTLSAERDSLMTRCGLLEAERDNMAAVINELEGELADANSERDALLADKARMDWLREDKARLLAAVTKELEEAKLTISENELRISEVTAERDELLEYKTQRELRRKELMTDPESGFFLDHEDVADLLHDRLELIAERDALRDENNAFKSHLGKSFTRLVLKKIKEKNK